MIALLAFIARQPILSVMLRKAAIILSAIALPLMTGSAAPPPRAPAWTVAPCPDANIARALAPARRLFEAHPETRALMISVNGCPALTAYAPGYSDANRFISWSMAKTVTAMLVGELVADGKLSLDAPAPIAEWQRPGDPRRAITLRHLLHMASGLAHVEVDDPVHNSDTNQTLFVAHTSGMAAYAIDKPLATAPGTSFRYSSLTTIILAEIITRTLTDSRNPRERARIYTTFAQERLFRPAGVTSAVLEFDGAGTQIGGSIMHMTLPDWARMGMLLLDGKGADGTTQVIAPDWLAFMKAPSPTNPEYGGQTWLNRSGGDNAVFPGKGPDTAVAMNGHLGQRVIASADSATGRGLVVVRLGNTPDARNRGVSQTLGDVVAAFDRR